MTFVTRTMTKAGETVRVSSQMAYLRLLAKGYTVAQPATGQVFEPGREPSGGSASPAGWAVLADGDGHLQWRTEGAGDWAARLTDDSHDFQVRGTLIGQGVINYGNPLTRIPMNNAVTIDGSTLTSAGAAADKVGSQNSVTFQGGFAAEASRGASNPGFLWGSNDFIRTGTTAGDISGVTDIQARLTEVHMSAPGANINNVSALVGEANVDSVGGVVNNWLASVIARGPENRSTPKATISKAAALLINQIQPGTATEQWAIYAEGDGNVRLGGHIEMNNDPSNPKTVSAYHGGFAGKSVRVGSPGDLPSGALFGVKTTSGGDVAAWIQGRGGQSGDLLRLSENDNVLWARFDKIGRLALGNPYAPNSSEMNNGELFLTVDPNSASPKLILTMKDSNGTVRSGSVTLS